MAIRPQVELKADSGSGRFGARSAARWTSVYSPGQHAGSPFLFALLRRSQGADHLHVQRAESVPETSRVFSRTDLSRGEGSEQASAPSTSPASLPGMNQAFVKKFYHAYPISARGKTTAFNKNFLHVKIRSSETLSPGRPDRPTWTEKSREGNHPF